MINYRWKLKTKIQVITYHNEALIWLFCIHVDSIIQMKMRTCSTYYLTFETRGWSRFHIIWWQLLSPCELRFEPCLPKFLKWHILLLEDLLDTVYTTFSRLSIFTHSAQELQYAAERAKRENKQSKTLTKLTWSIGCSFNVTSLLGHCFWIMILRVWLKH